MAQVLHQESCIFFQTAPVALVLLGADGLSRAGREMEWIPLIRSHTLDKSLVRCDHSSLVSTTMLGFPLGLTFWDIPCLLVFKSHS